MQHPGPDERDDISVTSYARDTSGRSHQILGVGRGIFHFLGEFFFGGNAWILRGFSKEECGKMMERIL